MAAFLTLREILILQYGTDLLSHEKARRAAALVCCSGEAESGSEGQQPLSQLKAANLEKHCSYKHMVERLNRLIEPLLSPTEEAAESRHVAPMETDQAESVLNETAGEG